LLNLIKKRHLEKLTDETREPEEAVLKKEERDIIAAAMNRLNSSARTLLALKYNLGLTEKEILEQIDYGISVKSYIAYYRDERLRVVKVMEVGFYGLFYSGS